MFRAVASFCARRTSSLAAFRAELVEVELTTVELCTIFRELDELFIDEAAECMLESAATSTLGLSIACFTLSAVAIIVE
jgi:hypothetical protein